MSPATPKGQPRRSGHADQPQRSGHADQPRRSGHADQPQRSGHADQPQRSGHADQARREPSTALCRPAQIGLEAFGRAAGLHPELIVRLVRLGLVDASLDPAGRPVFAPAALARVARMQRLRTGLSLNYAAVGLVLDLLDRIDSLEEALRQGPRPASSGGTDRRWT
jgi:chaperone modulatory protein CbpM